MKDPKNKGDDTERYVELGDSGSDLMKEAA